MSNNNAKDILAALVSALTASPSLVPATLVQVVQGVSVDPSGGFPFCRIYLSGFSSPVADTISYERTWVFTVEVVQEVSNKSVANAEADFANAVHAVLNRLQATSGTPPAWQLGIAIENLEVTASGIQTAMQDSGPVRVAQIQVAVTTLIQNPS